jgi:hypothetical protein
VLPHREARSGRSRQRKLRHHIDPWTRNAGGGACSPMILGMGAEPAHHEHLSPGTRLPIDAMGWRSNIERSDRLAALAVDLKPRRARHQGGANRRRPPNVTAGS